MFVGHQPNDDALGADCLNGDMRLTSRLAFFDPCGLDEFWGDVFLISNDHIEIGVLGLNVKTKADFRLIDFVEKFFVTQKIDLSHLTPYQIISE